MITSIEEDAGPAGVGDSALFASGDGGGNIQPRYFGAPEITASTNNQTLKADFRMTEDLAFNGGNRPRSRFGVGAHLDPGTANCCGPFNFFTDTRDGILVADIVGGDQDAGSTTEAVPWGGLGVDDVRGPNSIWYTLFVNVDYPNDAVRAKITTQDGSTDYGWSNPVPIGGHSGFGLVYGDDAEGKLEATHARFLLNGFTYMDNVSWTATASSACDLNADSACNDVDIDLLAAAVLNGTSDSKFNVDGLGDPDIPDDADFDFYITDETMLSTGFGDHDLDFNVNFVDFVLISNNFGNSGTGWGTGNGNTDDVTNFSDFVRLSNNFGMNFASGSNVPEPAVLGTLGLLSLVLLRRLS